MPVLLQDLKEKEGIDYVSQNESQKKREEETVPNTRRIRLTWQLISPL